MCTIICSASCISCYTSVAGDNRIGDISPRWEPEALRDMTMKASKQLFLGINGRCVKRSATNDGQFPAEWKLSKNNRPVIELNPGTFEPQ